MTQHENMSDILKALSTDKSRADTIPVELLRRWMRRPEIEVQSAIYDLLTSATAGKLVPNLTFEDYVFFKPRFFSRCIVENPSSDVALSRWEAATEFLGWFAYLWDDPSVDESLLSEAKDQLRKLYLEGSVDARKALIQGTLEHLFENASVRNFFADWLNDPTLQKAYGEATEWYAGGGHTPYAPKSTRNSNP